MEYVVNIFFNLLPVSTCFFCKVRSGLIYASSWSKVSTATAWVSWTLYQFPAREKDSILMVFRVFTLLWTGWTSGWVGRQGPNKSPSVLRLAKPATCSLDYHSWTTCRSTSVCHWAVGLPPLWTPKPGCALQLLASVCPGFLCTFVQWHREVHKKMP